MSNPNRNPDPRKTQAPQPDKLTSGERAFVEDVRIDLLELRHSYDIAELLRIIDRLTAAPAPDAPDTATVQADATDAPVSSWFRIHAVKAPATNVEFNLEVPGEVADPFDYILVFTKKAYGWNAILVEYVPILGPNSSAINVTAQPAPATPPAPEAKPRTPAYFDPDRVVNEAVTSDAAAAAKPVRLTKQQRDSLEHVEQTCLPDTRWVYVAHGREISVLRRLAQRGLVEELKHKRGRASSWDITEAGRAALKAVQS